GDTPETMAAYSQLDTLAALHGFVLVYPAVADSNWDTRSAPADSTNSDLLFIDHLLPNLINQYKLNPRRVYAIGMSHGATFAQLLAATRSSQIAAVVAHSGTPPQIDSLPTYTSPTLLIIGDDDPAYDSVIHHATKSKLPYISVPGPAHEWSIHHNNDIWQFLSGHTTQSGKSSTTQNVTE
ncbi:dienelactone hydrolase family protein, partial [bacterium]|nr:dienelactone hydrolase family protein [bacterium]